MADQTQRLQVIKSRVEKAKAQRASAEGQLKALEQQKEQIVTEMTALGVTPETIAARISELDVQINEDLNLAESIIPADIV